MDGATSTGLHKRKTRDAIVPSSPDEQAKMQRPGPKMPGAGQAAILGADADEARPATEPRMRVRTSGFGERGLPAVNRNSEWMDQLRRSIDRHTVFTEAQCDDLESCVDQMVSDRSKFREHTVDVKPLRTKYFFGFGYTYGQAQGSFKGRECVYPPGGVDGIPSWMTERLIPTLEAAEIVPRGWINAVAVNDYQPGGYILPHVDPYQIFERPIVLVNLFSASKLRFGCKFRWQKAQSPGESDTIESAVPLHLCEPAPLERGTVLVIDGVSANETTHGIHPQDTPSRRVSIILRRVRDDAPVFTQGLS